MGEKIPLHPGITMIFLNFGNLLFYTFQINQASHHAGT